MLKNMYIDKFKKYFPICFQVNALNLFTNIYVCGPWKVLTAQSFANVSMRQLKVMVPSRIGGQSRNVLLDFCLMNKLQFVIGHKVSNVKVQNHILSCYIRSQLLFYNASVLFHINIDDGNILCRKYFTFNIYNYVSTLACYRYYWYSCIFSSVI